MAVEKMYFMNFTGPVDEIDDYVIRHVVPNGVQLVQASSIIESKQGMNTYNEVNPYERVMKKAHSLCLAMELEPYILDQVVDQRWDLKAFEKDINDMTDGYEELVEQKKRLENNLKLKEQMRIQILLLQNMNVEVENFFHFKYMKFRFGKLPKASYEKLMPFYENLNVIVEIVSSDMYDYYLMYFVPNMFEDEVDQLFESLYFKRIRLSGDIKGLPENALKRVDKDIKYLEQELFRVDRELSDFILANKEMMNSTYGIVHQLNQVFSARQYAVCTKEAFLLSGWIPESGKDAFVAGMKQSDAYTFEVEDEIAENKIMPPTNLKNHKFFQPFEMLINMYAVPSYREMDPTIYVGLTYLIMCGIMFGDLGQGFVIAALGYLFYRKTKLPIGKIAIYMGISSMISGTIYGSFFGNEELLREILPIVPMVNPIEKTNQMLLFAVILGCTLIVSAMLFNIFNAIKKKDKGRLLFDRNGLVGLLFYLTVLLLAANQVMSLEITPGPLVALVIGSMVVIFFSHPLQELLNGHKDIIPEDKVGFFVESFFELVETILGILSNTISFVRVGAFALNHVGFFMAFHMLSSMVEKSAGNAGSWAIMLVGNVLIIVLEGLIVAIQGLRLEYYELFSRFFEGAGTEYKPFIKIKNYTHKNI